MVQISKRLKLNNKKRQQLSFRRYVMGIGTGGDVQQFIKLERGALRNYLEDRFISGMSWENYGKLWVIDHVVPLRLFDLYIEDDLRAAWHYKNLHPLLKMDNLYKEGDLRFSLLLLNIMDRCEIVELLKTRVMQGITAMDKYLQVKWRPAMQNVL